jgi:hypothetical protein
MVKEVIHGRGHRFVTGAHRSTFEVTCDPEMTSSGDCIIVVGADRAAAALGDDFKAKAASNDAYLTVTIRCGDGMDVVEGWGSDRMTFTDPRSMVFRVSDYVCGRTVMINADKPASRLDRRLIEELASGKDAVIELSVETKKRDKPSLDILFME